MSAPSIAGHRNNVPKHPNVLRSYAGSPVSVWVYPLQQRAQMSEEDLVSLLRLETGQCARRGGEGSQKGKSTATGRLHATAQEVSATKPAAANARSWFGPEPPHHGGLPAWSTTDGLGPGAQQTPRWEAKIQWCWVPESDPQAGEVGSSERVSSSCMMQTLMLLIQLPVPET